MEGQLDEMVSALQASDMEQRLKEAGLNSSVEGLFFSCNVSGTSSNGLLLVSSPRNTRYTSVCV